MAEQAMIDAMIQEFDNIVPGWLKVHTQPQYKWHRCTEEKLNADYWVDARGNVVPLDSMEESYLRNVLLFLYKQRDRLWLNCHDVKVLTAFSSGDSFFEEVVQHSVLWNSILDKLNQTLPSFDFSKSPISRKR